MTDQERELLRECRDMLSSAHVATKLVWPRSQLVERVDALLAQEPKAASRGRLTYDKATRTIRDERGKGVLVLTEEDADMFASAAPDSGMPEEPKCRPWTPPAEWYEYTRKLRAYALSLRETIAIVATNIAGSPATIIRDSELVGEALLKLDALQQTSLREKREGMVLTDEQKKKVVASLLVQLWITLPLVPAGTMPNYEQSWAIAESVLAAAPKAGENSRG